MRLLLRPIRCSLLPNRYNTSLRKFTTSTPTLYPSPTTLLVSRLRKETGCSISKAREALTHLSTTTDPEQLYTAALEWLEQESAASASKKAAKLGSRTAKEGLIATTILQNRGAAIIELNSETDF
ncbi:Elongation factor Ts, mitochondrial, partial [Rhizophlyctis rosea]